MNLSKQQGHFKESKSLRKQIKIKVTMKVQWTMKPGGQRFASKRAYIG